jgi:hypothetical protein
MREARVTGIPRNSDKPLVLKGRHSTHLGGIIIQAFSHNLQMEQAHLLDSMWPQGSGRLRVTRFLCVVGLFYLVYVYIT